MDKASKTGMNVNVSCPCGSVQLSLLGEPDHQLYCHCRDCQAVHGGAFASIVTYRHESVQITAGEVVKWTLKTTARTFCKTCCTLLYAEPPGAPFKGIEAHLLPAGYFRPTLHMQCGEAPLPIKDSLPHYRGFSPDFGGSDEQVEW